MARRELVSLSLYALLASNRGGLFIVFLPLYLVEVKGASLPAALVILSLAYIPASLLGPFVGRLSDRAGRRRPFLLAGEATAFPLFLAIVFAPGYVLAGALFVAAQLALAIGSPAYNAYVADVTHSGERGFGYGLLNATSSAGGVVGFLIAGWLTLVYGLGALFPFVVAVMVGTVSVVVFLVPEPPAVRRAELPPAPGLLAPVYRFSFAVSIRAIGNGALGAYYGYLAAQLGANPFEVSVVAVAGLLTGALVSLPLGRWIDRRGELRAIWYGTMLAILATGIFAVSRSWVGTIPAQAVRNAGLALVSPGMQAWVARTAPAQHRAEAQGAFALVNSTLWSVGPLAGAIAIALGGSTGLYVLVIVTTVISLALMELLYGEMGVRERWRGRPEPRPGAG
ncbi:MAG TPA: MFS transporter [Thermoplasmata archaeon]|nr:MFS transporter [Thermoplasmata archaeon]